MNSEIELAVIMPVYNEEEGVEAVLNSWIRVLDSLNISYQIHAYNDGSRDGTLHVLNRVADKNESLVVHDQLNKGHGPTILQAYKEFSQIPWIFQVDSDDEMKAEYFNELWRIREKYDFILGKRHDRQSPWVRKVVSILAFTSVRIFFGQGVSDVNVPFRLMRVNMFCKFFKCIPDNTFAPNVIVSGIACVNNMRIHEIDVPYEFRQTGTVSIKSFKFIKVSMISFIQTILFVFRNCFRKI